MCKTLRKIKRYRKHSVNLKFQKSWINSKTVHSLIFQRQTVQQTVCQLTQFLFTMGLGNKMKLKLRLPQFSCLYLRSTNSFDGDIPLDINSSNIPTSSISQQPASKYEADRYKNTRDDTSAGVYVPCICLHARWGLIRWLSIQSGVWCIQGTPFDWLLLTPSVDTAPPPPPP